MRNFVKLPVGIENFEEIRTEGFHYVDKTALIEELLERWGKVNLFTRPRRFGKTLNMSMLRYFFEIGTNPALFDGLYISHNKALCEKYMGKYPVIFISLKDVDGLTFEDAEIKLRNLIREEAQRHTRLGSSDRLSDEDRKAFEKIVTGKTENVANDLRLLSKLLYIHYGQKVIILIDEYDVPLDKAFNHGYYREMVTLIRSFMGQALKTNEYLQFAVLTGCLRVSKESIFTGLNNFKVLSIDDVRFDEHFGFTDAEVKRLLDSYGLADHFGEIKAWYDGYHFGNTDVYCPWDVINHVDLLCDDPKAEPKAYWINTSGNDLVRRLINRADRSVQADIERLIAGETIEKAIRLDLTYDEIDNNINNLWSVLFTTGYLTQLSRPERGIYKLMIPNREVREIFVEQVMEWFRETMTRDNTPVKALCRALKDGDAEQLERQLSLILNRSISVLDTKAREGQKENFYHGLLLGLFRSEPEWLVRSNVEAGEGFCDIIVEPEDLNAGIVIEVKYAAAPAGMDSACEKALAQIRARGYGDYLHNEGRDNILIYGIAFYKKRCRVMVDRHGFI